MFGLSWTVLAIAAVSILTTLTGGAATVYHMGKNAGKAVQRDEDAIVIAKLTQEKADLSLKYTGLQKDFRDLDLKAMKCSKQVYDLGQTSDAVRGEMAKVKANAAANEKKLAAELAARIKAANTPSNKTPQQQCEAVHKTLGELSDRLRSVLGFAPPEAHPDVMRVQ